MEFLHIFSNREIATAAWMIVGVLFLIKISGAKGIVGIVTSFFHWRLSLIYLVMLAYIGSVVWVLWCTGVWKVTFLKDTIIWFVFSGFTMLFASNSEKDKENHLRSVLISGFSMTLLIEFVVSFSAFNLFVELIQIPILFVVGMMVAKAQRDEKHKPVGKFFDTLLVLYGVFIVAHALWTLFLDSSALGNADTYIQFFLPLILQVAFVPLLYLIMTFMEYKTLGVQIHFKLGKGTKESFRAKWESVKLLGFRLKRIQSSKMMIAGSLCRGMSKAEIRKAFQIIRLRIESNKTHDDDSLSLTVDGWDGPDLVEDVNVWWDFSNRSLGVIDSVKHGEKVQYVDKSGDYVHIRTQRGQQGWVNYGFILELKNN